jgi:hypothetical protein
MFNDTKVINRSQTFPKMTLLSLKFPRGTASALIKYYQKVYMLSASALIKYYHKAYMLSDTRV